MTEYRGFSGRTRPEPAKDDEQARQDKIRERRFSAAHRAFDGHQKLLSDSTSMLSSFANNAMRAPPFAAAAGVAGLLGFFSANKDLLRNSPGVEPFNQALFYFCLSIGLAIIAPSAAYLSQSFFTSSLSSQTFHYEHEFVRDNAAQRYTEP